MERGFVFDNSFDNSEFSNDTLPLVGVLVLRLALARFDISRRFKTDRKWLRKLLKVQGLGFKVLDWTRFDEFSAPIFWRTHCTRMCTLVKYPKSTTPRVRDEG